MKCLRCKDGLMSFERFEDFDDAGEKFFYGWWCVFCGEIIDVLILEHRRFPVLYDKIRIKPAKYS